MLLSALPGEMRAADFVRAEAENACFGGNVLGNDLGFPFDVVGVEHLVLDAELLEHGREDFAFVDRAGSDQNRAALRVHLFDLLNHRLEFRQHRAAAQGRSTPRRYLRAAPPNLRCRRP